MFPSCMCEDDTQIKILFVILPVKAARDQDGDEKYLLITINDHNSHRFFTE